MASEPFLPPEMWESGTNQNSIPANDNALRFQISQTNVNNATTAQPVSPTEGATYIIQSTHTGTQWATFTPKDLAIYSGGTWYAFSPVEGNRVTVSGQVYVYTGGVWSAATGGAYDMLSTLTSAEISVTGATTATFGRMHVCSGTSADYTLTLPAVSGNAGKLIGVRIAPGCTRWITVDGNSSELIDGALTRLMWATESAILFCDGVSWTKVGGKSKAISIAMKRTTAQACAAAAWTIVPTPTVIRDNTSAMAVPLADTTNGRIRIVRDSSYVISGFVAIEGFTPGVGMAGGVICNTAGTATPADDPNGFMSSVADVGGFCNCVGTGVFRPTIGNVATLTAYNQDSVSRNTRAVASVLPTISLVEQCDW